MALLGFKIALYRNKKYLEPVYTQVRASLGFQFTTFTAILLGVVAWKQEHAPVFR